MSRGRKPNNKTSPIDWSQIFKKNEGRYFSIILSKLGSFQKIGSGCGIDVLNEIINEKEERKIKDKKLPKVSDEEIPFRIPKNWIWCRLGEMSINRDGERNPISLAERNNREKIYDYYGASGIIDKIDGYTHEGELLLIGEDGANLVSRSTPIAFIATGKYWVNNHAHVLETVHRITLDYLKRYINSIDLTPFVTGGFQPKLSQGNLNIIPVPLPPISFQEKIMEFFTDFENNRIKTHGFYFNSQIEKEIIELHKSQLLAATIITENNFQLTLLDSLNQAILQEAVQGKLVPQDPNDEPASELLQRIKAEKEKSGKKEKPLPPIKPEEIPFEIPSTWVWCRLGEIALFSEAGKSFKCEEIPIQNEEWGVIKVSAVSWDNFLEGQNKLYSKTTPTDLSAKIEIDDFIISRANTSELVGKSVVVKRLSKNLLLSDKTIRFKFSEFVLTDFINLVNNSAFSRDYYSKMGTGTSPSMKNITREHMNNLLIPFPPLSEQKRIVVEIERQMAKTKQLKQHILANQQATEQLLKALLHQAFEGEAA